MTRSVSSRELSKNIADVLRRVESGEEVVITRRGEPIAALIPLSTQRRRWLPRTELVERLAVAQADPGLRADLATLTVDTRND